MESLNETLVALGDRAHVETLDWFAEKHLQLHLSDGETVTVVPMIGVRRLAGEMITAIRVAMNRQGFACNEDDATELLLHFAINDEFCLCGDTVEEAELCARTMYLVTLLLIKAMQLKQQDRELSSLLDGLKEPVESTEIRLPIRSEKFAQTGKVTIEQVMDYATRQPGWHMAPDNREGIRVSFDLDGGLNNGWFLLRLSVHASGPRQRSCPRKNRSFPAQAPG